MNNTVKIKRDGSVFINGKKVGAALVLGKTGSGKKIYTVTHGPSATCEVVYGRESVADFIKLKEMD